MRTFEINNCIIDLVNNCKSPFYNLYVRFYIDNKLFETLKISYSYHFCYKGVYFKDISSFLDCNNHFDYFDSCDYSFLVGKITCHGHGEFYGIDKLFINFRREH